MSSLPHSIHLPVPAVRPQPRRWHEYEVWVHTPTAPWGSRRLPRTLLAGDPRRTLYRSLLRRAEGVPVLFADGKNGVVTDVGLPALGFDFWADELIVATPDGRQRVSVDQVTRIDTRRPLIEIGARSDRRSHRRVVWPQRRVHRHHATKPDPRGMS